MDNNNNNKNNNSSKLQLDMTPEIARGKYSNFAVITHTTADFILDFAKILPGMPKAVVGARVITAPEHAKRLLMALQENIISYEREFGTIHVPPRRKSHNDGNNNGGDTIAPFGNKNNEA